MIINPLNKLRKKELDDILKIGTTELFNEDYYKNQEDLTDEQI